MNTPLDLIRQAGEAGVTLTPRLWANEVDRLEVALREQIKGRERAIIQLLLDAQKSPPINDPPQWVQDILEAEKPRPIFTPGQAAEPAPGARCGCCKARSFWNEAEEPKGWRCMICHPPEGAAPGSILEIGT